MGSAGRYMSMANGPTAVRSPSTIALLAKDGFIFAVAFARSPGAFRLAPIVVNRVLHGGLLRRNKGLAQQGTFARPARFACHGHAEHQRHLRDRPALRGLGCQAP